MTKLFSWKKLILCLCEHFQPRKSGKLIFKVFYPVPQAFWENEPEMPTEKFSVFTMKTAVLWYLPACFEPLSQILSIAIHIAGQLFAALPGLNAASENSLLPVSCTAAENHCCPSTVLWFCRCGVRRTETRCRWRHSIETVPVQCLPNRRCHALNPWSHMPDKSSQVKTLSACLHCPANCKYHPFICTSIDVCLKHSCS